MTAKKTTTRSRKKKRKKASERRLVREKVEFFEPEAQIALTAAEEALRAAERRNDREGTIQSYDALKDAESAMGTAQTRFDNEVWG